jgi:hypothetical protein
MSTYARAYILIVSPYGRVTYELGQREGQPS